MRLPAPRRDEGELPQGDPSPLHGAAQNPGATSGCLSNVTLEGDTVCVRRLAAPQMA